MADRLRRSRPFTLVPWRLVLERHAGKRISGILWADGINWTLGRSRSGSEHFLMGQSSAPARASMGSREWGLTRRDTLGTPSCRAVDSAQDPMAPLDVPAMLSEQGGKACLALV
jgi:hypothetical protein